MLIQYPYFQFPGTPQFRPVGMVVAVNTLNGKRAEFLGILDSGADGITLTADLAITLGIDWGSMLDEDIGGVHGIGGSKYSEFLQVGLIDPIKLTTYFPNGRIPIPVYFSPNSPFCLLGRKAFLDMAIATFDGPRKLITLQF